MEGSSQGYGISLGRYIVVDLPFVSANHQYNEVGWWGDAAATVGYAKQAVPNVIATYGGNPNQVLLTGFSRGAIAVSYIGLYDDQIASLWTAFYSHCIFDGMIEWIGTTWGSPLSVYRQSAITRLNRLKGRPILISDFIHTGNASFPYQYLPSSAWTQLQVDMTSIFGAIPNSAVMSPHNDKWALACGSCPEGQKVQSWLNKALKLR